MQDVQWSQLTQRLLYRGWRCRDNTLFAPRETMWFTLALENLNLEAFRERMSRAVAATSLYEMEGGEQADVYADLVSLIGALDEVLAFDESQLN